MAGYLGTAVACTVLNILALLSFISWKGNVRNHKLTEIKKNPQQGLRTVKDVNDTIIIIDGIKFRAKSEVACKQMVGDSIKRVFDFLNTNIRYFGTDIVLKNRLYQKKYYESL